MSVRRIYQNWISPQRWLERAGVRPPMQIVMGVVMLTSCVLMIAKTLQLMPSEDDGTLRVRTLLVEMVASRIGAEISMGDLDGADKMLTELLHRQDDVLSIGVRGLNHKIILATPNHERNWRSGTPNQNTPTHMQVLMYEGQTPWATLEIAFKPLASEASWSGWWSGRTVRLTVFILGSCFLLYWFFFSRMLRMLDPSAAVPERLQLIMDTLVEGVAILDNDGRIVLLNQSFAQTAFESKDRLIGRVMSSLPWLDHRREQPPAIFPWNSVTASNLPERGVPLRLRIGTRLARSLKVNAAPILDPGGTRRGVLVTFGDQTVLESDNAKLALLISEFAHTGEDIRWLRERLAGHDDNDHLATLERLAAAASEVAKIGDAAPKELSASSPGPRNGGAQPAQFAESDNP